MTRLDFNQNTHYLKDENYGQSILDQIRANLFSTNNRLYICATNFENM